MRYSSKTISKTISTNNCFTNNKQNIEQTYFATLGGPYYITLCVDLFCHTHPAFSPFFWAERPPKPRLDLSV